MNTPIIDFVQEYCKKSPHRFHMPAHKGKSFLGFEQYDITEIDGADSLFDANGIIAQSEKNASQLFGCPTYYSTEGSSLCIRAMLYLAKLCGVTRVIATRNCHKTFLSAVALLDIKTDWLYPNRHDCYLSASFDEEQLIQALSNGDEKCAVYITSPDYLGNIADISRISAICKEYGAYLLVDNAHGAYLGFLPQSMHPIHLGADICCDSAHKTLPVLTGGAYLHISPDADIRITENAKNALSLFGSTSPSYLILQSLDLANKYLAENYRESLSEFIKKADTLKSKLTENGYTLSGVEALKIVIKTKEYGYFGHQIAEILKKSDIFCEFYDKDNIVLMLSPENSDDSLTALSDALCAIERAPSINEPTPEIPKPTAALSIREAILGESERIKAESSIGRVLAQFNIACPPAVPIAVCGEVIDEKAIECFKYYETEYVKVIKDLKETII